jgi:hypothetical protein
VLVASIPAKFSIQWGASAGAGYIRPIPAPSQIGINNGFASLTDGFPPLNFLPLGSGGVPPFGQDMNGILNQLSAWSQWFSAGGAVAWDVTFSSEIGGYPKGALVGSPSTIGIEYLNLVDNNGSNPESSPANWVGASPSFFGNCGGSGDAITGTFCTAYLGGQFFIVKNIAATNTTTTPTFNPGSGAKTITDRRGNALAPGDLPVSGELMLEADGIGYRYLGIVAADLAGLKTLFNVQQFTTTTRVTMTGNSGNSYQVTAWSPGSYTKLSATSKLVVLSASGVFCNTAAGPTVQTINIGSGSLQAANGNSTTSGQTLGMAPVIGIISGVGAGAQAISLVFNRYDSVTWTGSFCQNSTDAAWFPAVAPPAVIIIGELGP